MLWCRAYVTRIEQDFHFATGSDALLCLVMSSWDQVSDVLLWTKLIAADLPEVDYEILIAIQTEPGQEEMAFPPSALKRCRRFAGAVAFTAVFAYIPQVNTAVIGAPTEDAWDAVVDLVRSVGS